MWSIRTCRLQEDTLYEINNVFSDKDITLYGVKKDLFVTRKYLI